VTLTEEEVILQNLHVSWENILPRLITFDHRSQATFGPDCTCMGDQGTSTPAGCCSKMYPHRVACEGFEKFTGSYSACLQKIMQNASPKRKEKGNHIRRYSLCLEKENTLGELKNICPLFANVSYPQQRLFFVFLYTLDII
jgi:hypothetical protein